MVYTVRNEAVAALAGGLIGFGDPLIKISMETAGLNNFLFYDVVSWIPLLLNWHFLLGMSMALIGSIIYVVALANGKASIINPLSGGASYITIVVLSSILLGETVTIPKTIGIFIIIIGIYLLSRISSTGKPLNIRDTKLEENS